MTRFGLRQMPIVVAPIDVGDWRIDEFVGLHIFQTGDFRGVADSKCAHSAVFAE